MFHLDTRSGSRIGQEYRTWELGGRGGAFCFGRHWRRLQELLAFGS